MQLNRWIDGRHLTAGAAGDLAARFATDPFQSLCIDDFLLPGRLDDLRRLFAEEGQFEEQFFQRGAPPGATGHEESRVSQADWLASGAELRASAESMFLGPRPQHRLGRGMLTHLSFLAMLDSPAFHDFLRAVTGIDPVGLTATLPRIFRYGHFVSSHSDASARRRLCAVFYLSPGWQPDFGGALRHLSLTGVAPAVVAPLPNRLVLFMPRVEQRHEVLPLTEAGRGWERWAYSLWFGPRG